MMHSAPSPVDAYVDRTCVKHRVLVFVYLLVVSGSCLAFVLVQSTVDATTRRRCYLRTSCGPTRSVEDLGSSQEPVYANRLDELQMYVDVFYLGTRFVNRIGCRDPRPQRQRPSRAFYHT